MTKSMTKSIIISVFIGLLCGVALNNAATNHAKAQVYAVCQESRMSSTINETQCGELQDKYGVEFLCAERNNLPTNNCWTEAR